MLRGINDLLIVKLRRKRHNITSKFKKDIREGRGEVDFSSEMDTYLLIFEGQYLVFIEVLFS